MLASNLNVFVMDSFIVGSELDSTFDVTRRHLMQKVTFASYDALIGAYHEIHNHWNLLYVHIPSRTLHLIDPYGDDTKKTEEAAIQFRLTYAGKNEYSERENCCCSKCCLHL